MSDLLPVLIVALISVLIGVFIGLLLASLRSQNSDSLEQNDPGEISSAVRVWQAPGGAKLHVDVQGKPVSSPAFLNGDEREQLRLFSQQLARWMGEPASPPVGVHPEAHPGPVVDSADASEKSIGSGVFGVFRRAPAAGPATKSISAQIDEILQFQLEELAAAGHPLGKRSIRIKESPGRGTVVYIDGVEYEGVGAVTDPLVSALLRRCVADWEAGAGAD